MRMCLDCMPCFFSMCLKGMRKSFPDNIELQEKVLKRWALEFADIDFSNSPPAVAGILFGIMYEIVGDVDLFAEDKHIANKRVLELLPHLRDVIFKSDDKLINAIGLSIIGNYMDCAVADVYDWESELMSLDEGIDQEVVKDFYIQVLKYKKLLILGDNAGEIGLDTILVEILVSLGVEVIYAVRGGNILNDATLSDAEYVNMTNLCKVVSSGARTPGTVLDMCSDEFRDLFNNAPIVLSKGQGNFESLYGESDKVYFALKIKCPVVGDILDVPLKTSLFRKG